VAGADRSREEVLCLETGDEGRENVPSGRALALADGQQRGDHRHARVAVHRRQRDVVEVQRVAGGRVREDGVGQRELPVATEHRRLAGFGGGRTRGDGPALGTRSREGHADGIEDRAFGQSTRVVGHVVVRERCHERSEVGCHAALACGHRYRSSGSRIPIQPWSTSASTNSWGYSPPRRVDASTRRRNRSRRYERSSERAAGFPSARPHRAGVGPSG